MMIIKKYEKIFWILGIIIVWELVARSGLVNTYILPPFTSIVFKMKNELLEGILIIQVWNSIKVVIWGMVLSIAVATGLVIIAMRNSYFESFINTICTIMNPLPGVALIPLFMVWFGIGTEVLIALIIHAVIWPLITNLLSGLHSVPQIYIDWEKNIESSLIDKIKNIYFYCILPNILSGLRIGWGRSWRALISGEMIFGMIGELGGIGYYIYKARAYGNMEDVYIGIILIVITGLFVENCIFSFIEKNTISKWGMTDAK